MAKYRIIGNMTGNSMDAIDLVLTEFDGEAMTDICSFSTPYNRDMQKKMRDLRAQCFNKTKNEILALPEFDAVHDEYIRQIADSIKKMLQKYHLAPETIDAIGFHGKTLDHNPPSKSPQPYTLQIGSGQMLADLTGIKVVYDFRSDYILNGYEGAPLVPPHNAHISAIEGDGCYYNGGNTSNFALIHNKQPLLGTDSGPCNEYIDDYIRQYTDLMFDDNGRIGQQGQINFSLLQKLFDFGRDFYEMQLPKSGDPAYYKKEEIFAYIQTLSLPLADVVRTLEYFSAYIAVYTLGLVPQNIPMTSHFILFGGGWKNPIIKNDFISLLNHQAYILPEHKNNFIRLSERIISPDIRFSNFGTYMEARLMADMAYHRLQNKVWPLPEILRSGDNILSGVIAVPERNRVSYSDKINRAAKNSLL